MVALIFSVNRPELGRGNLTTCEIVRLASSSEAFPIVMLTLRSRTPCGE